MKKRLVSILLLIVLVLGAFSAASAESIKLAYAKGSIKLRSSKTNNYTTVTWLKDGQSCTVLEKGDVFSKIELPNGKKGYVKNLYISGIGTIYADGTNYTGKWTAYIRTKGGSAAMKAGADAKTPAVSTIPNGTKVNKLGTNGAYTLIEAPDGTQGFVASKYVTTTSPSSSSSKPSSTSKKTAVVTGAGVYLRQGASKNTKPLNCLAKGSVVTILSTSNAKWWKVQYKSQVGYMYSAYLKKK